MHMFIFNFKIMKKIIFILSCITLLYTCHYTNFNNKQIVKIGDLTFQCKKELKDESAEKLMFLSNLQKKNQNVYFVAHQITNTNKYSSFQFTELFHQALISDDSIQHILEYRVNEIKTDEITYHLGEYVLDIDAEKYMYYMMVFEYNGNLYEYGLKCLYIDKTIFYDFFIEILYSIKHNNDIILKKNEKISVNQIFY